MPKSLTEMRAPRGEACLSDLTFDKWRAGEVGAKESSRIESHLAGCARCRERREEIGATAEAFLERFPVFHAQPRSDSRAPARLPERRPSRHLLAAWGGAALAASVLLFVGLRSRSVVDGEHGTRIKGSERIDFVVRRGEHVFESADGQALRPGDQLRFIASTQVTRYLAILSHDAAGVASVYYPTGATHARLIAPAQSGPLDSAVELDATLGPERLYGIFCDAPFEIEPLRAKLERERKLAVPPACRLDELEFVKESPP